MLQKVVDAQAILDRMIMSACPCRSSSCCGEVYLFKAQGSWKHYTQGVLQAALLCFGLQIAGSSGRVSALASGGEIRALTATQLFLCVTIAQRQTRHHTCRTNFQSSVALHTTKSGGAEMVGGNRLVERAFRYCLAGFMHSFCPLRLGILKVTKKVDTEDNHQSPTSRPVNILLYTSVCVSSVPIWNFGGFSAQSAE